MWGAELSLKVTKAGCDVRKSSDHVSCELPVAGRGSKARVMSHQMTVASNSTALVATALVLPKQSAKASALQNYNWV